MSAKLETLQKMVTVNPEDGNAWYLLGLEYAERKMVSEALQAFANALRYGEPDLNQSIMNELANLAKATGFQKAETDITDSCQPGNDHDLIVEQNQFPEIPESDNSTGDNVIPFTVISGGKITKTNRNQQIHHQITFAEVGGLEELKEVIRAKIIKPFTDPELFQKFKKKIGGGILLFGPPGCGKTFIAKATAGECHAKFIPVHITDVLDPYIGISEQNIKDIFSTARAHTPCILFFDELDALGFNRAKTSSQYLRTTIDQLLSEIEGIESNTDKILIIGATNMPWDVDPAFKRPGRFDRLIFVPPPDAKAREAIFQLKLSGRPVANIDYRLLAAKSELYSGADIENVVELAAESVINEIMVTGKERPIGSDDLLKALEKTNPSTIEWLRTIKNYVKYANQGGLYNDVAQYLSRLKKI